MNGGSTGVKGRLLASTLNQELSTDSKTVRNRHQPAVIRTESFSRACGKIGINKEARKNCSMLVGRFHFATSQDVKSIGMVVLRHAWSSLTKPEPGKNQRNGHPENF